MMRRFLPFLAVLVVLCGCARHAPPTPQRFGAVPVQDPLCDAGQALVSPDGGGRGVCTVVSTGSLPIISGGAALIWRPGGTASGNIFTTCATVSAALAASPGSWVTVDTTLGAATVGTGCALDFQGYGGLTAYYNNILVTLSGTGQIRNMPNCTGMVLGFSSSTTPGLTWNYTLTGGPAVIMSDCFFQLNSGATASPIQIPANTDGGITEASFEMFNGSGFTRLGGNTTPIMTIGAGSSAILYYSDYSATQTPLWSTIASGAGALLVYGDDTLFPFPTQSGLSGGLSRLPLSRMTGAGGLWYDASANVVGGAPTCIGPAAYCFGDASPEPTGVGEVLQIVKAGPLVKFAPINGRNANSFTACDGGEILVGGDGGIGNGYCVNQSSIGAVTSVTGSAPITCSPTTGAVSCSISAATTGALGTVELANDLGGTGASPVVLGARGGGGGSTGAGLTFGSNGQITCGLTATDCQITQQAGSGLSAVGNTYLIESQQETGSGSTGGDLELYSASGAATNGILHLGVQGTDAVQITTNPSAPEVDVTSGSNLFIGNLSSTHLANGTNMIAFRPGSAPSSNIHSSAELYGDATNGLDLMDQSALTLNIKGAGITQTTAAQSFTLSTTTGTGAASTSGASGSISVTTGNSAVATSGTATGAASGLIALTVGNGRRG